MVFGSFSLAWMTQFAHLLKESCDWRIVALARSALAFGFAFSLARMTGAELVLWRPAALWLRGVASSLSLLCLFFALTRLPTAEVLTLTNTVPIWVAFLSWPLLRIRPTLSVWLAAACGVLGVLLIQSPHLKGDFHATSAVVLSLVAALTSAVAMLGLHRLKGVHPWAIVTHYSGVATLFVLGTWVYGGVPDLSVLRDTRTMWLLLGVGATATLGQVCVTKAFTSTEPARVAVVGLTQIVFALGLDVLFSAPDLHPATLAGIAFVLAPTAWMMVERAGRQTPTTDTPTPVPIPADSRESQPIFSSENGSSTFSRPVDASFPRPEE